MAKMQWQRPERKHRAVVEAPIAEFAPVNQDDRCETCVGLGVLYRVNPDQSQTPIECFKCKGTGINTTVLAPEPTSPLVPIPAADTCWPCGGTGRTRYNDAECWVCSGTGIGLPQPPPGDMHFDGSL